MPTLFLFGKHREAQRFLYHSRPQRNGAEEKETDYGDVARSRWI
nr:MAG TPA: hypothetical protein [Caudoviricetes sp.]